MTAVWIALGAVIGAAGAVIGELVAQRARKDRKY